MLSSMNMVGKTLERRRTRQRRGCVLVEPVVLQAVLLILVELAGGTGGTRQEDLDPGSTWPADTGSTCRCHMGAPNLAEFHRFHQFHRQNASRSSVDEIANHGDDSFGPVVVASSRILGSST